MLCQSLVKRGDITCNVTCSLNSSKLYLGALKNLKTKVQVAWEPRDRKQREDGQGSPKPRDRDEFLVAALAKRLLIFPGPEE